MERLQELARHHEGRKQPQLPASRKLGGKINYDRIIKNSSCIKQ
jgi:hypothetical protein